MKKTIKAWAVRGKFNRLIVAYQKKEYAENFYGGRNDVKDIFPCTISYSIPKKK